MVYAAKENVSSSITAQHAMRLFVKILSPVASSYGIHKRPFNDHYSFNVAQSVAQMISRDQWLSALCHSN